MNRSTARWTSALATAALFALPAAGLAQQASPATPNQSTSRPAGAEAGQQGAAHEHLRKAKAALNDIPAASLTGTTKARVTELKRHLTSLEQAAAAGHAAGAPASSSSSARPGASATAWATDVAAVDRILSDMLGAQGATGATEPAGTTGSRATAGSSTTLDEPARAKLQEVRTHVTAFAAAMGGSAVSPSSDASADAAAAASPAAASAPAAAASAEPTQSPTAASTSQPAAAEPTAAEPTTTSPSTAAQQSTPQSPAPGAAPAQPSAAAQPDPDTVKRHLTAARDSLSQMTQLPAAGQLSGDARAQVSQLISNFNELITTNVDWRAAYAKVQTNLTALVGDQKTDESPAPATGTPGAVGTSGTVTLDPSLRAKLMEFRSHLLEFEKAAGGSGTGTSMAPSASATSSTSAAANPTASAEPSAAQQPAAASGSTARTSSPTGPTGPTGTTGTTSPETAPESQSRPSTATASSASSPEKQSGHAEAMQHIEAIEAILNGRASGATAGTTGSASSTPANAPSSLDRAQIEQIRTHLNQLRRALNQSGDR